jgi:hypothetical protein
VAGFIYTARKVAWLMLPSGDRELEDWAMIGIGGLFFGLLWPIILLGMLLFYRLPKTPADLEAEVEERDRRIRELERELGIGGSR